MATISTNMPHARRTSRLRVLSLMLVASVLFVAPAIAETPAEQQCHDAVQGKVAWSQGGSTKWNEGNVQKLCKGTTDPAATVACFQTQITAHNDWSRGIAACAAGAKPVVQDKPAAPVVSQPAAQPAAPPLAQVADGQYEEFIPDMPEGDIQHVMAWIKANATVAKTPFCWRQSHPRDAGEVPGRVADCPAGYTNNGLTCGRGGETRGAPSKLADCPAGFTNMGFTCFRGADTYGKKCTLPGIVKHPCRDGYTDMGCTCTSAPVSLSASSMTCSAGYHLSDIDKRCIVDCPPGFTNTGETCYKPVSTLGIEAMTCKAGEVKKGARCYPDGTKTAVDFVCAPGKERDGLLCYNACQTGFHGVGPVCWENCPSTTTACGAGCATSKFQCGSTITDEIVSVATVVANIATLGIAAPETGEATGAARVAEEGMKVGGETINFSTKVGRAFKKAINVMQSIKPSGLAKDATVVQRIYKAKTGTKFALANTTRKVVGLAYTAADQFNSAYAEDFATQTSSEINDELNKHFIPDTATYLKKVWAGMQLHEMAAVNDFKIAQDVLTAVSIVDITGATGLVSSFTKPICGTAASFPSLSQSYR